MKTSPFIVIALLGLWVAGQGQENNPKQNVPVNPLEGHPEAVVKGQKLFAAACSGCHGTHAEGGRGPNLADGSLVRRKDDQHLFNSIRQGVPGADMPPFNLTDAQIWELLAFVHSLSLPAAQSPMPGDAEAGEAIFFGKGGCGGCHMILGRGGFLGPDLSNIGMAQSWNQLRQVLLDPNSGSQAGFQGVTVVANGGAKITGIVKNYTNYSIVVQDAGGNLHPLSMGDVSELIFRKDSLMPRDYSGRLTPQEIDDLLAFLGRQSVRPISVQPAPARPARNSH